VYSSLNEVELEKVQLQYHSLLQCYCSICTVAVKKVGYVLYSVLYCTVLQHVAIRYEAVLKIGDAGGRKIVYVLPYEVIMMEQ